MQPIEDYPGQMADMEKQMENNLDKTMKKLCDIDKTKMEMDQARERLDMLVRSMGLSAEMKQTIHAMLTDLQEKAEAHGLERGNLGNL